jgi:hypothetical protein
VILPQYDELEQTAKIKAGKARKNAEKASADAASEKVKRASKVAETDKASTQIFGELKNLSLKIAENDTAIATTQTEILGLESSL